MPIRRARDIDDLYGEVADYDLVLVPDAPLASALNRRIDRPHLGTFAIPPRRLAAGRREAAEDRLSFLEVVDRTDLDWKQAAHAIGNVLQCWEYQGTIDAILDYDRYATMATQRVVEVMRGMDTTSRRLTRYSVDDDLSVAAVGPELFTPLERSILPEDYDTYDAFTGETFELPPFQVFDSAADIVDTLLDAIDEGNADDVAVVLDEASQYSTLVESALEAAEVPFYGGPGFVDDPDHRTLVQLLRAAHAGSDIRVEDVRPVLERLGDDVEVDHDRKRVHDLNHPGVEWIVDFCESVGDYTFDDALAEYERRRDVRLDAFREELDRLNVLDDPVTETGVDRLEFYLQTYEVPIDRENEGVLLADAKSAAYVDRPVVFYLGLDEDWTHSSPRRPWVDTDEEFERNVGQFQLMIQNGVRQYYFVQDAIGGHPVTPCFYFDELLDRSYERFSDLDSVRHSRTFQNHGGGFDREATDVDPESVKTISQSSLSTHVNCPRDYFFDRLVDGPDRDYFSEGNLFHDFAEFYVNHPDAVDADVIDEAVEIMVEETAPLLRDVDHDLRRTRYRIGLETIVAFFEAHPPDHDHGEDLADGNRAERDDENYFADHYERPIESPLTERWFENEDLGMKGLIDLVHGPDHLVDHKSGSKKRATSVVKNAATDPPSDRPNFQAPLYLSHYRSVRPDRRLRFTFFHFLERLDDAVVGDVTLEDTQTSVEYHPVPFDEYVPSKDAYEVLLDGYSDCRATFEDLGFEAYRRITGRLSFPGTTEKEELRASEFAAEFTAAVDRETSDSVDAEKGCDQAIRALNGVRRRNFFADDLDRFEGFVTEQLADLNRCRAGEERFPVEGPAGEPNYRYVDNRDLILDDD
ncbi:hypothetical protein BRD00_05750 [Halobacteriales archaeon QS_8_69_26]|nr:MAG: hypothetical protein BRD00_05750 [Halobacteriales archaeon QS_8_69_26]